MEENENISGSQVSNEGYTNAGVISLRLDTNPLLEAIEANLKGTKIIGYKETNGVFSAVTATIGKPKCNELGVQSVMTWLTPIISPHTVQGNYKTIDDLNEYLIRLEIDLFCYLMINIDDFDISEYEIDGMVDMIINTCEPFFTRLIDNKERESYGQTMVHRESRSMESSGGGFNIFKK